MVRLCTLFPKNSLLSGFHIYNASAGSGKTYQLTKSYLGLLLSNVSVKRLGQILALTFTNKAVAEMKSRILDSLFLFGNPEIPKKEIPMFLELSKELQLSEAALKEKSRLALKLLLHNYGFFEISTIDKFTHRIIKTFARDLKIAQNFEVELDKDTLLDQAIAKLLRKAGDDGQLAKTLIDFSFEKIDENRSWDVIYDLHEMGGLLFEEMHFNQLKNLVKLSIVDFDPIKQKIRDEIRLLNHDAVELANRALETIQELGFEFNEFSRGTLPNHFKKIAEGERNTAYLYKNRLEENLENGNVLLKGIAKDPTELCSRLLPMYVGIKSNLFKRKFFSNALSNILPLTVLNELGKQISIVQKEKELLHISEFNKLIFNEIANQPVPYIYERLGEKFRHYFIDEFQDTSVMQWANLIPLIGNALETESMAGQKGSLLLLGDAKQSIYRWRGGDPKQFIDLSNKTSKPFSIEQNVSDLGVNWRSFDTVITFNNEFFSFASAFLKNETFQGLYRHQCEQLTNNRTGGYVEIEFLNDAEDIQNAYCASVYETVQKVLEKGYRYGDICILVRKNKHGVILANYLAERNVPLISSEALLLSNNPEVFFLVALLRVMDNPKEPRLQYDVLEYLFKDDPKKHDAIIQQLGNLPEFLESTYLFDLAKESSSSVLNIVEKAIHLFGLKSKIQAHVLHFLDVVLEVTHNYGIGINEFLNYWNLKKDSLSIPTPTEGNSVQLMTIHKAKGLEFQIVIFPFADSKINDRTKRKKIWVPLEKKGGGKIDSLLVNTNEELKYYSQSANERYENENNLAELDDMNILYVALTRAIEGLFVITKESKAKSYGAFFKYYLDKKNIWAPNINRFLFGSLSENLKRETSKPNKQIPYIYTPKSIAPKVTVTSKSLWDSGDDEAIKWGNQLHYLLAQIYTPKDIDSALFRAIASGLISKGEKEAINDILVEIVSHPKLSQFYNERLVVKNEKELINGIGMLLRPDRLVFENEKVSIIDYKTGTQNKNHHHQLESYSQALEEMQYVVTNKILVYIGSSIKPVFI